MNDQSMTDDQELAKVLASASQDNTMQFEETGALAAPAVTPLQTPEPAIDPVAIDPITPLSSPVAEDQGVTLPVETGAIAPITPSMPNDSTMVGADADLEQIKQTALTQLRPLVGKLNLSPEEKFDTYLLLLRSTDDRELIAPAHEAATAITDEARRAQALLDIIKEIDFLSQK